MSNLIWGIPVILVVLAGFLYSRQLCKAGHYDAALLCIMICGLVLRVYAGADGYLHEWDERYHALVAENLARHPLLPTLYDHPVLPYDYRNWTVSHIWLHKQPLTLWLMAGSLRLFGLHPFAVRIPAILLSTLAIRLVYDIARSWYGREVAMITAFLFAIHGLIIDLAAGREATDSVDVVFLFCIVLAVWLAIKAVAAKSISGHLLAGAAIGLAILAKWLPALIVLPVWAVVAYPAFLKERARMVLRGACLLLAAAAVALPWQLYILHAFPAEAHAEYAYNTVHLYRAVEGKEGGFFYYFDHLRMQYGEAVYLPVILAAWHGWRSRKAQDYAVAAWFWIPYLFFSLVATKMMAYTVIAAPAVFIMTACGFVRLRDWAGSHEKYRYMIRLVALSLLLLPVRYSIERIKPFTAMDRNPGWNKEIESMRAMKGINARTVLFNCRHPVETMFAIGCTAYEQPVDSAVRQQLLREGYMVMSCR